MVAEAHWLDKFHEQTVRAKASPGAHALVGTINLRFLDTTGRRVRE